MCLKLKGIIAKLRISKTNWHLWVLGAIIIFSFLLRIYNFSDWLYFEADQVRNANNAHDFYEWGFTELPLLGPKAGGTNLHLGPLSYYFEITSGLIFGYLHPARFAIGNFIFLLVAIPLFFFFLKSFFSLKVSLLTTSVFASSYFLAQYARFSWNPNSIPFWTILFVFGLIKLSDQDCSKRNWWLVVTFLAYAVLSQLHFVALIGFGAVGFFYWVIQRPKIINWKFWLGGMSILIVSYVPLIVYDLVNSGQNIRSFLSAFNTKTDAHSFVDTIGKFGEVTGKYVAFVITSLNDKEFEHATLIGYLIILLCGSGTFFLLKKRKDKQNGRLRNLLFIWTGVFSVLYFKLAYSINEPRFWLPILPLLFVLLAGFFAWLEQKKHGNIVNYFIVGVLIFLNITATFSWYWHLSNQKKDSWLFRDHTSTTLKQDDFITYQNIQKAVSFMTREAREEGKRPCFTSPSTYLASYKYVFNQEYVDASGKRLNNSINESQMTECLIFIIEHKSKNSQEIIKKFEKKGVELQLGKKQKFGLVEVWTVKDVVDIN